MSLLSERRHPVDCFWLAYMIQHPEDPPGIFRRCHSMDEVKAIKGARLHHLEKIVWTMNVPGNHSTTTSMLHLGGPTHRVSQRDYNGERFISAKL